MSNQLSLINHVCMSVIDWNDSLITGNIFVDAAGDWMGFHRSVDGWRCNVPNYDVLSDFRALSLKLHTRLHISRQVRILQY